MNNFIQIQGIYYYMVLLQNRVTTFVESSSI